MPKTDPLKPSLALLVKLGSIAVHVDEMLKPGGHEVDRIAIGALLRDAEVKAWMKSMDDMAMLPKQRVT